MVTVDTKPSTRAEAREPEARCVDPGSTAKSRHALELRAALGNTSLLAALRQALASDVGDRVREARGALPRATVAHWLCVHENTIGKIERGESMPDAVQLLQLAAGFGRTAGWLLGEEEAPPTFPQVQPATEAVEVGDWVFVPLFDVYASAGHGAVGSSEDVEGMRPFTRQSIRDRLGIRHNRLCLVRVAGDSMEPQIHSGDLVMVDRMDAAATVDGPHLVRIDGALMVKSVQRKPGGRVRVTSQNPAYDPFEVVLGTADDKDFEVLGRVRWAGVSFR